LAKLTEGDGAKSMTEDGQFLGSLPWASPEQVSGGGDMDVRSDVYSLGVVLHQMLTGEFPYTVVGPVREVVRTIAEVEPRAASGRNPEVGDEVDTIVLRCLNKAPERRYQSAGEISADVRRYLTDEPIEAKRDSSLYVLKKHVRRHRTLLLLGLGLAVSLLAFAIHANVQAAASRSLAAREAEARIAAEAARREAAVERDAARDARDAEQAHRREAEFEAARSRAVTEFFVRTFGVADPNAGENGGVTLLALVTRAAAEVGTTFESDPASEAAVRLVLGRAFATFGRFEEAREHLARAVELHEGTLQSSPEELYEALWTYTAVLEESSPRAEWRSRCRQLWALYPRLLAA
jgi:non-specific serine/threonine protein kinase/serine/threonine-protein kinase